MSYFPQGYYNPAAGQQQYPGMPTPGPSQPHSRAGTPAVNYNASVAALTSRPRGRPRKDQTTYSFKGLFSKEIAAMLYGYGDVKNPAPDTVAVLEEMVIEYILELCETVQHEQPGKNRLKNEDLRMVLRRDPDSKLAGRLEELLFTSDEIQRARDIFDPKESKQGQ